MRIPKKFMLKGKLWRVKYERNLKHEDGTECDGLCDVDNQIIWLDKALKGRKKTKTFLHEWGHAVVDETGVRPNARFSETLEDILVETFGDAIQNTFYLRWKKRK